MHDWANVAELTKTKTLTGGLVARCAPGLPFLLEEGLEVAFVPPQLDTPRSARVTSVREEGRGTFLVTFDAVGSIDVAERLVGSHCLVRRADLPEDAFLMTGQGLEGYILHDKQQGMVGTVRDLIESPAQALLEVERPNGKTALVPLVDAFLVEWDEDERTILMDLPAGLLDL